MNALTRYVRQLRALALYLMSKRRDRRLLLPETALVIFHTHATILSLKRASRRKPPEAARFFSTESRSTTHGSSRIREYQSIGQPQSYVARIESGERQLLALELLQICRVLGISVTEVVASYEGH